MALRPERLLRLYPPAWRARYEEEFLAAVGQRALGAQDVVDIVSGAIDAWLSADVRRATSQHSLAPTFGGSTMLKSMMACGTHRARYTTRDALIGAGVMLALAFVFALGGSAARREGSPGLSTILLNLSFTGSAVLSMPFWLMKGQPWKAQAVLMSVTLTLVTAIAYLSTID